MTPAPPDGLASILFRALYADFDLITTGALHIVTPTGTPVFISDSLGDIARRISVAPAPAPRPARQIGTST